MRNLLKCKKGGFCTAMIIFTVVTVGTGHYFFDKGHWGKDGKYAVKDCVGTHQNGNCAMPKLNSFELQEFAANNQIDDK